MNQSALPAAILAVALPCGLSQSPASAAPMPAQARYFDMTSYLTSDADFDAWSTFRDRLRQNFDDICGDIFCEGDYSNIQPLRYRCSVNRVTGRLAMCMWMFAGSNEEIEPATGEIAIQDMAWHCRTPLVAGTTAGELLAAMQGDGPLDAPLPIPTRRSTTA